MEAPAKPGPLVKYKWAFIVALVVLSAGIASAITAVVGQNEKSEGSSGSSIPDVDPAEACAVLEEEKGLDCGACLEELRDEEGELTCVECGKGTMVHSLMDNAVLSHLSGKFAFTGQVLYRLREQLSIKPSSSVVDLLNG